MFDPMMEVPKTNEEAVIALKHGKSEVFGGTIVGIFQVRLAKGWELLDAYEYALRCGAQLPTDELESKYKQGEKGA